MKIRRTYAAAALWGLAEATFFFIVPDVLLSWIALKNPAKAYRACLWALAGALLGGGIVWYLGATNAESTRALFSSIPAINDALIADVQAQLENNGLWSVFIGPMLGWPYKIYALEAAASGFGLAGFLLISVPARLIRFFIVTSLAIVGSRVLSRFVAIRGLRVTLLVIWAGFYALYFYAMA